jgi:hypothetical protein
MSRDPIEVIFDSLDRTRHLSDAQIDQMIPTATLLSQVEDMTQHSLMKSLRRRLWRRGIVASTIAVLVVGSAAAAISLSRRPVETVAHMTCYRSDSLRSTADVVSYDSNPLAVCSQLMHWSDKPKHGRERGDLCLLSGGSLAAFPPSRKAKSCSVLGLATFNGELANPEAAKFQLAVETYFNNHSCPSLDVAHQEVLQLMGMYGLVGWRIRLTGSTATKACATLAFRLKLMDIDIVAIRP